MMNTIEAPRFIILTLLKSPPGFSTPFKFWSMTTTDIDIITANNIHFNDLFILAKVDWAIQALVRELL
jgi:hypothetical protein